MKFVGQRIQKLEPTQDRQTDRHDSTHYHATSVDGKDDKQKWLQMRAIKGT